MESQLNGVCQVSSRKVPVEVVKAAVLFGVQALGYDEPTEEQMHILRAFCLLEVMFLLSSKLPTGSGKYLCYAALLSAFGYLRSVGSLSGTHSTRHRAVFS